MDSMSAFAKGEANRRNEQKVFDWDKAAELIKERNPRIASAGLSSDWEWTGGTIYQDNKPDFDSYTYLASTWATPELDLDGNIFKCFKMQSEVPDWSSDTKWPQSALEILGFANVK